MALLDKVRQVVYAAGEAVFLWEAVAVRRRGLPVNVP